MFNYKNKNSGATCLTLSPNIINTFIKTWHMFQKKVDHFQGSK